MTLTLPSFAKINWTLEILGKRPDGYHEVRTLLQTVSVADELTFELTGQGITIHCDHPEVPCDETNLAYRAAKLLGDFTGAGLGVRIRIAKQLPLPPPRPAATGNCLAIRMRTPRPDRK